MEVWEAVKWRGKIIDLARKKNGKLGKRENINTELTEKEIQYKVNKEKGKTMRREKVMKTEYQ